MRVTTQTCFVPMRGDTHRGYLIHFTDTNQAEDMETNDDESHKSAYPASLP